MTSKQAIFDGHNDILSKLWQSNQDQPERRFFSNEPDDDINLPKAIEGGLIGGLCAIFCPYPHKTEAKDGVMPELAHRDALASALGMAALLAKIERHSPSQFKICRTVEDIEHAKLNLQFAAVCHIEGAEAIGPNFDELYVLQQAGLRSLGFVWSRPNIFGFGVPTQFNSSPDIGPGLTEKGKELVKLCNQLHVLIDLAHMNEKGFWDVAKLTDAPLVSTHSSVHKLCPLSRNLTDNQIDAIGESGGLIGVNFGVVFIRADGQRNPDTEIKVLVNHIRYIADRIGVEHVALGSDFDGTTLPSQLANAAALPCLVDELKHIGFCQKEIDQICFNNWVRVLTQTW